MDRGMDSSLLTKKLDRNNYASWSYKMHQYLLRHGYWSYVDGANDTAPNSTHIEFTTLEHSANRVLYCFAYSGGKNGEGYLGKSEKDFRCKHHNQEAPTLTGVEQLVTTRLVDG